MNKRMTALVGLLAAFALVVAVAGIPYMTTDLLMAQGSGFGPGQPGGNPSPFRGGVRAGQTVEGGAFLPNGTAVLASKGKVNSGGGVLHYAPGQSTGITFPGGEYDVYATYTDASGTVWYLIFNGTLVWIQG